MFKSLKGAFINARMDIKQSLNSMSQVEEKGIDRTITKHQPNDINPDAGAELLKRYQDMWEEIHKNTESNARLAQNIDVQITDQFDKCEKSSVALNDILRLVSAIPQVVDDTQRLLSALGKLENTFTEVNEQLSKLEDAIDIEQLSTKKLDHVKQLKSYKQKKHVEMEVAKVRMAKNHTRNVIMHESRLQSALQEKQEAFLETYRDDLAHYQLTGSTLERPPPASVEGLERRLGEFVVDEKDELERFLEEDAAADASQCDVTDNSPRDADLSANEAASVEDVDKDDVSVEPDVETKHSDSVS